VLYDEYAYIRAKGAATHPFRDDRGAALDRARSKAADFAATLDLSESMGPAAGARAHLARETAPLGMHGASLYQRARGKMNLQFRFIS